MIRPVSGPEGAETEGHGPAAGGSGTGGPEEEREPGESAGDEVMDEARPGFEAGAPVGPGESEEAAFLAEQRIASGVASAPMRQEESEKDADEAAGALPPLEDLVKRIPTPTRALIDELFRAKFVTVKRMPKEALK